MANQFRDDCPHVYNLDRRYFLAGSAVLIGSLASSTNFESAQAAQPAGGAQAAKFMQISSLLIDHKLNDEVGARMAVAMATAHPGIDKDIEAVLSIAAEKNAKIVEDFFPDLPDGRLKEACLAIISAWYTGVVVDEPGSVVYAYEFALMYQPTHDVMTIPSYAISGPNGWNASAPPLTQMPTF